MRKWKDVIRGTEGEGYIDAIILVFCAMLVIALAVRVLPVYITKLQLDNFADELVREAEIYGRVGTETSERERMLREKTGLTPVVTWSKTGNIQLKIAVVTALLVAGIFAVTGICLSLKKEEPQYVAEQLAEPEMTAEPVKADISTDIPQPSVIPEIVISTETVQEPANDGPEQSIQSAPEKTEDLKPQEPPAEAEDTGKDVKENPPANTEIPAQPTPEPGVNPGNTPSESTGTPQNGAVTDGKIYIDGFGWINYNGGKSEVVQDGEIYENGNTIGTMD